MPNETNRTIHPTAPQPVNPNYPMAALDLTGGQKFGWLALGFLSGITGILIAWLTNAGNPQMRSSAVKFAIIGFAINFVLVFLLLMRYGCASVAPISSVQRGY